MTHFILGVSLLVFGLAIGFIVGAIATMKQLRPAIDETMRINTENERRIKQNERDINTILEAQRERSRELRQ